jgi:apolipoprotein N-acyltransferase
MSSPSAHPAWNARRRVLAVVASAALYAAAFPPLSLHPLAWVALVPLLVALAGSGVRAGALLGLLWGASAGAGVASFLPGAIDAFFGVGLARAGLGALAIFALAGLPYAAFGAWVAWLARRGAAGPLHVAAGFGAAELLRASGPFPIPWALLAYSQAPDGLVAQSADLVGPFGLGMAIAAGNAVAAGVVSLAWRGPRPALARVAAAAALVATLGYGAARRAEPFGVDRDLSVALVQGAVAREARFQPEHRQANLARHLGLTERAAARHPDLIVWPEFALDFPLREEPALRAELVRAARASGAEILLGGPDARVRQLVREETNSAFLLRDGRIVDRYDKIDLLPFSEAVPLGRWLGGRDRYRAGGEPRPLRARAAPLGVLLCSEAMHPGPARALARSGARLLSNPSNDDWFTSRAAARQQLVAASFRAVENRRWVLRPASSGYTAAIDPHGRIRAEAPFGSPEIVLAQVRASDVTTLYQRTGDAAPRAGLLLVLATTLRVALRDRPRR